MKTEVHLTAREKEVLHEIVLGQSNKQIAEKFRISLRTVDHHRSNMYPKLGAHSAADAVRIALTEKLVTI